jgi:hypothetical protein
MVEKILFKLRQSFELCRSLKDCNEQQENGNQESPSHSLPKQKTRHFSVSG